MKNIKLFYLLLIVAFFSCNKEATDQPINNSCPHLIEGNARYMFAPDSAAVNSSIKITFVYENQIPCQQFSNFLSNTVDSITTVVIYSKVDTCNCVTDYSPTFIEFSYIAPATPGHSIIRSTYTNIEQHADTIVIY